MARLSGIILNSRGVVNEVAMVEAAAKEMDTQVVVDIPRDGTIQLCEEKNMTVVEGAPDSALAEIYHKLARGVAK